MLLDLFLAQVEQLHKIFKLCGSPSEEYWKKSKLPNATLFKPQQPYKSCIAETFKNFPPSSIPLIETLLSIDPDQRGTATEALNSEVSGFTNLILPSSNKRNYFSMTFYFENVFYVIFLLLLSYYLLHPSCIICSENIVLMHVFITS